MASFRATDGSIYEVPDENAQAAVAEGWQPLDAGVAQAELDAKRFDSPVEAGAISAARGFSFGLSDWALTGTGLYSGDELKGLSEANPTADVVGDIAGNVAGLLLPGPNLVKGAALLERGAARLATAGLERAAPRIAESVIGRTAEKVVSGGVGGMVGGGLWGMGRAVSELGTDDDPELSAERLIAHIGEGMKFGGAMGSAVGGLEALVSEAGRGISRAVFSRKEYRAAEAAESSVPRETQPEKMAAEPGINPEAFTARPDGTVEAPVGRAEVDPISFEPLPSRNAQRAKSMRDEVESARDRAVDLGDEELDDDELSGLIGAGFDGVAKGADWATKVVEMFGEKTARPVVEAAKRIGLAPPTSEQAVLRGLDFRMAENRALRQRGLEDIAPALLRDDPRFEQLLSDRANPVPQEQRIVDLIQTKAKEAQQMKKAALQQLDSVAAPEDLFDGRAVSMRMVDRIAVPLEKGSTLNEPIVQAVLRQAEDLEKKGLMTLGEADAFLADLDKHVYAAASTPSTKPLAVALRKVRYEVAQEIRSKVSGLSERTELPQLNAAYRQSKVETAAMINLGKGAQNRLIDARQSNNWFSLGDQLRGNSLASGALGIGGLIAAPFSVPLAAALGVGSMLVNKWTREQLPFKLAFWLKRAAEPGPEQVLAKSFHRQVRNMLEQESLAGAEARAQQVANIDAIRSAGAAGDPSAVPMGQAVVDSYPTLAVPGGPAEPPLQLDKSVFGKFAPVLKEAVSISPAALFATHAMLSASSPEYAEQMDLAGFGDMDEESDSRAFQQAIGLSGIQRLTGQQQAKLEEHVDGFLSRKRGAGPREKPLTAVEVKQQIETLGALAASPQALEAAVGSGGALSNLAPRTSAAMSATVQRAAQALRLAAPNAPPPQPLKGYADDWSPARSEIARYQRVAQAVLRPMSVLENMQRGSIDLQAVQALRTVYPQLAPAMAQTFMNRAVEKGARLTQQQRIMLSALMGQPLEPSLEPKTVLGYQMASQNAAARAAQGEGPKGRPMSNSDSPTVSQQLEGR